MDRETYATCFRPNVLDSTYLPKQTPLNQYYER
jgi:hypothetical protein